MKKPGQASDLSRRERQIMDAIYKLGNPTAVEIRDAIPNPPSGTAVRTLLTILEQKGHIRHREDGPRYVYEPVIPREEMAVSSLQRVVQTFFDGSIESVFSSLLSDQELKVTDSQLERLTAMIEQAKREGR